MDILKLIKKDHDEMDAMFEKFDQIKEDFEKNESSLKQLFDDLKEELTGHMRGEEEILYPKLKPHKETRSEIMESLEEHHVARLLMREIESVQMGEKWVAKMNVFKEIVQHHNHEEEEELFEPSRELLGKEELNEMGPQFKESKK